MKKTIAAAAIVSMAFLAGCSNGADEDSQSPNASSPSSSPAEDDAADTKAFAEQDANAIGEEAVSAMTSLTSVTVAGEMNLGGTTADVELSIGEDKNCTMSITAPNNGGTADVLAVDGQTYLKADDKFWASTAGSPELGKQITTILQDRWAILPGEQSAGFTEACDLDNLLSGLESTNGDSNATVEGTETVAGTEAVKLTNADSTVWVATSDPHYVVQVENKGETYNFSKFDEPLNAEAPAEEDTVDLQNLNGGGQQPTG